MNTVTCNKESGFPLLPEITIKNEQNKVVVRKVPVDGEFAKFGVKEGDVIESVNGISFKGFDNNKVFSTLSVMTGNLKIVFVRGGVKESVVKGKRKQKGKTKEEQCSPDSKVKKEPKTTSQRKNFVSANKSVVSKSFGESLSETNVNIESIIDDSKRRKELVLEELKGESPQISLEECPECDEKFSCVKALSEHYTVVHTVIAEEEEEEEPTSLLKVNLAKKERRKPSKKGLIKTETISVSEHFPLNEPTVLKKPTVQELEKELIELKKKMESNKDLENSLKGLKDDVDKKYNEMSDLKSMVLHTEKQLENERELNKKENDRNKALAEEIKKLKKNQSELQKKFKLSDSKNIEYLANECKEVDANNEKNERFKEMEEEIIFLKRKVDQLSKENDSLVEETMKVAQKEKEVLRKTIDEKIIEMEKLKTDKCLSKKKIRNLEKKMEAFKTSAEQQIEVFKTNAGEIQLTIESENKDLKNTVETQKTKINDFEKELKVTTEKVNKYKRDVSKLMEKISRKEDVIDRLMKEKKDVADDEVKKVQIEKKLKTYQDTILQKSGIISKLEEENQKLLETLQNSTMESEEKELLKNLKSDVKNFEATIELNFEKIISLEMEIERLKICNKDSSVVAFQEGIRDLKRNNVELKAKCKDLEDENHDTLNDHMQNHKAMVLLNEKNARLKENKREMMEDLEEQRKITEKLYTKNKVLQKEVAHMSQLQVELKSLKQKIDLKSEASEIKEDVITKSRWDNNDDSDSSYGDEQDDEDWKFVNDTIDEIMDKSEKKKELSELSELSDDETDFDSTKFIEHAKSKAYATKSLAADSNDVIFDLNSSFKENATVRNAIADMLGKKDTDNEERDDKVANDDLALRRTFGDKIADKFSLDVKNNRSEIYAKEDRRIENKRRGYNRNNSFNRRGGDIDIRSDRNRIFKRSYQRKYNKRNSMRNYPSGNGSNYYNIYERRDRDVRDPFMRRILPHERRNVNDPRRWSQEGRIYGQNAVVEGKNPTLNLGHLSMLEPTKVHEEQMSSSFENENPSERSPSMDRPSTSTVNTDTDSSKASGVFVEERNVDLTENCESEVEVNKHSLEDEEEDFMNKKKFKSNPSSSSVLTKFRPSKASRNEIRAL